MDGRNARGKRGVTRDRRSARRVYDSCRMSSLLEAGGRGYLPVIFSKYTAKASEKSEERIPHPRRPCS